MVLNDLLAGTLRSVKRFSLPAAGFFLILFLPVVLTFGQTRSIPPGAPQILGIKASLPSGSASDAAFDLVDQFEGLKLERIDFDGVDRSRFTPLPDRLARIVGTPLTQEKLAIGLRAVYATGLFETVDVEAVRGLLEKNIPAQVNLSAGRFARRRAGKIFVI